MSGKKQELAPELRRLVRVVEAALGEVIAEAEGPALYQAVESVRKAMVALREGTGEGALAAAKKTLQGLVPAERSALARAYTIYLELVNLCENAYRTHRLRARWRRSSAEPQAGRARAVWVLTAHPTESRSPTNIELMHRAQDLCLEALERGVDPDTARLRHLLHLVWRTGTHPNHKPTVEDEARHLFSLVDDPILEELIQLRREGHEVYLRTWVGGDKDGHPGVGPEETDASLNLSRTRLLAFVRARLTSVLADDVRLIDGDGMERPWRGLQDALDALRVVTIGDGRRIHLLREALKALRERYRRKRGEAHPALVDLGLLLEVFPGLVIPLELREERGLFAARSPIAQMLHYVGEVARGGEVAWYARGLVVSMTGAAVDLLEAQALVGEVLGGPRLPVIPLFELPDVLERATTILEEYVGHPDHVADHDPAWGLEVMLGYSDTSKRMGVLASRLAIHDAMQAIDRWAQGRELSAVFFHGSGGSVGRGGGTVEEQFATWPPGACRVVKQTLQGEMVERTLATPEILRGQVLKIAANQASPPEPREPSALARRLAKQAQATFVEIVGSRPFLELLSAATPYARLGALNIGSRPVSRPKGPGAAPAGLEGLRAIPWVLCWTQTRYLLHAWLGTGAAWRAVREAEEAPREALLEAVRDDPLLRSYLRVLGFTLAKTAPEVWREYVATLGQAAAPELVERLEAERADALDLARQATDDGELLSYRPWLRESIFYRAPMIHPLNLLQIEVLKRPTLDEEQEMLFRETVTGVAAGMLTTG